MDNYEKQEQKLLSDLGIKNFRYLTKNHVFKLNSMLSKMDPEVAKEALSKIPHFFQLVSQSLTEYKDTLFEALKNNDSQTSDVMQKYDKAIEVLSNADDENLSVDDRVIIAKEITSIANSAASENQRNREWLGKIVMAACTTILAAVALTSTPFGNVIENIKGGED